METFIKMHVNLKSQKWVQHQSAFILFSSIIHLQEKGEGGKISFKNFQVLKSKPLLREHTATESVLYELVLKIIQNIHYICVFVTNCNVHYGSLHLHMHINWLYLQ